MNVMGWLKKGDGEKTAVVVPAKQTIREDKTSALGGLDFAHAMDSHARWKHHLEDYIEGVAADSIRPDLLGRDNECHLGQWLHGHGVAHFGYLEAFAEVRDHHARLHRLAGDIVLAAHAGKREEARRILDHPDYLRASERLKLTLSRLYVQLSDGNAAVAAHQRWKVRLADYVAGKSREEFDPVEVAKDSNCALGKWLNGPGHAHYGAKLVFGIVKESHSRVHQIAGEMVQKVLNGDREQARLMLEEGEFAKTSTQLSLALQMLLRPH